MKNKDVALKILVELCRLLIGVVFIFSGFVKAVDPVGGAIKIGEYLASFGLDMLQPFTVLLSFNLSAIAFALGVCMLLGVYRRYVSFLVLVFMVFMTPLTLYLALFDPVSDCGCFGDALVITNWETFFKNIVLSLAAIVTFIYNQRLFQCFTYRVYWFVALYAYLFGVGFAYYNYNHLPVIDFRPYKVGANIPQLMEMPEGAPQDEYKYTFVYEKDGVKKEFSLEDYPANDSSWTFVESKTELVKKGYQPPVAAFNIYNGEGDDVTEEIRSWKMRTTNRWMRSTVCMIMRSNIISRSIASRVLRRRRSMPGATIPEPNILSGWQTRCCLRRLSVPTQGLCC